MGKALTGEHYCEEHQGNHSHYAAENCTVCKLQADNKALTAQVERLREALVEAYNEQLNTSMSEGYTKTQDTDILWSHGFRSDGEWLVRMCGLDDKKGWYDFDDLRSRIPEAANRMVDAALAYSENQATQLNPTENDK